MTIGECYQTLGLSPGASKGEISSAYRRLAMEFHPDHHPEGSQSAEMFIKITEAYQLLLGCSNKNLQDSGINAKYSARQYNQAQTDTARETARAWARMRYEEAAKKAAEIEKASIHSFLWSRKWNYFFIILALFTLIDCFLPPKQKTIESLDRKVFGESRLVVEVDGFRLEVQQRMLRSVAESSPIIIRYTPIFHHLHYFYFDDDQRINSPASAFPNLIFLPFLLIFSSLGILFLKINKLEYKIALKFLSLIALVILSIAWVMAP